MKPGDSTEPTFRIRTILGAKGAWVLRDELDEHGVCVGRQQLQPDGWWSEYHTDNPEFWAGYPDEPTDEKPSYRVPEGEHSYNPEFWAGEHSLLASVTATAPVTPAVFAPPPMTVPAGTMHTDADGRVWTSTGTEWMTKGGASGTIVSSSPPPPGATFTPEMVESITDAINKARTDGTRMTVTPMMQKMMDEHELRAEAEFLYGAARVCSEVLDDD